MAKPYAYVMGNPLNGSDPTGLDCSFTDLSGCAADVGNAVGGAAGDVGGAIGGAAGDVGGWAKDNLPNCTIFQGNCAPVSSRAGVCVSASAYGGIGAQGSVCIAETNGWQQGGMTFSGGYGLGLGASAGIGPEISNAKTLHDYEGPFVGVGGGPVGGELQVSPDANACGGHTWVGSAGVGPSTPNGHISATNTVDWRWW